MAMFARIEHLVSKEDFRLRCWDDRYSRGVWACVAPISSDLEEVEGGSEAGDLDMIPAMEFVESADWLPFVTGSGVLDALTRLEDRLQALPEVEMSQVSQWSQAVTKALEHMREVRQA